MALAVSSLKYNYVSIQNPDSGLPAVDLTNHLVQTEYFECCRRAFWYSATRSLGTQGSG